MIPRFRAWHKPTESMQKVESVDFKNHTVDLEGGEIEQYFDDVILMQATGLQDRNIVDIYEGDVLKFRDGRTAIVRFDFGMFGFTTRELIQYEGEFVDNFEPLISWNETSEVIGNIYENPNLLEEEE